MSKKIGDRLCRIGQETLVSEPVLLGQCSGHGADAKVVTSPIGPSLGLEFPR